MNEKLKVQTASGTVGSGQPQVATLVKTVSTPGNLAAGGGGGAGSSVTIPVSAISVGQLPQMQVKGLTVAAGGLKAVTGVTQQQQLRQFTIQHQLLQQRKVQQQQQQQQQAKTVTLGAAGGATAPISTVSAAGVSKSGGGGAGGGAMSTTVTMQQLQQVIRQVTAGNAQVLVSSPSSAQGGIGVGGGMVTAAGAVLAKNQQGQTVQARVIPVTQQGLKQTIQV